MNAHEHHEELMQDVAEQLKNIFDTSEQAIYIYLDDFHKVCNKKFTDLLGYDSPAAWAAVTESFPETFVAPESQTTLIDAFGAAMQQKVGSTISVTWKKKDGDTIVTSVILVPMSFQNHLVAVHFVSKN